MALSRDRTKLVVSRYFSKQEMEARGNGLNAQIFELAKPAATKLNKMYKPIVHPQLLKIMYGSSDEKRYAINTELDYVVLDGKTQLCHLRRYYYSRGPASELKPGKAGVALLPSEVLALFEYLPTYLGLMHGEDQAEEEEEEEQEEDDDDEDKENKGDEIDVGQYCMDQSQPDYWTAIQLWTFFPRIALDSIEERYIRIILDTIK